MRLGTILGRSSQPTKADDDQALREARIAAACRNPRWTEVPDDLVTRGRCLVSAATDEMYTPHCGVVFETGTAHVIADMAQLVFTVTDDRELRFLDRQPGTWSQVVERQAGRRR